MSASVERIKKEFKEKIRFTRDGIDNVSKKPYFI